MAPSITNNVAYTAPINPPGATPILTRDQIWAGMLLKIRSAEAFVPHLFQSTTVLSESIDPASGHLVTVREIVFIEDQRKVKQTIIAYEDTKIDFIEENGSRIHNVISEGENGELYMTYSFEWRHPGASEKEMAEFFENEKNVSRLAVHGSIRVMRELVSSGKI